MFALEAFREAFRKSHEMARKAQQTRNALHVITIL